MPLASVISNWLWGTWENPYVEYTSPIDVVLMPSYVLDVKVKGGDDNGG